jgi:AcrR family transcriptional regulator
MTFPTAKTGTSVRLRERTRGAVREQVAAVALTLFAEQGFDRTTVEQLAAAAGMSRTTFFRYFASKEDVVLVHMDAQEVRILDLLTGRPDAEPVWDALRFAFATTLGDASESREDALRLTRTLIEAPSLLSRHRARLVDWHAHLVPEIARRLDIAADDPTDPRAAAIAGAAVGCAEAAQRAWVAADGRVPLSELIGRAMAMVAAAGRQG